MSSSLLLQWYIRKQTERPGWSRAISFTLRASSLGPVAASLFFLQSPNCFRPFFRTPPPQKRQKATAATTSPNTANRDPSAVQAPLAPKPNADHLAPPSNPNNPRKRRASQSPKLNNPKLNTFPPGLGLSSEPPGSVSIPALLTDDAGKKRGRTNTPWSPQEEQRLKQMRDAGNSWVRSQRLVVYACRPLT